MPAESSEEQASLRDIHVFLVADDSGSRDLLRSVLEDAGALVSVVVSARSAVAALEAIRPDVLVADVTNEAADPVALIRRVRALPGCAEIPSIVVTADGSGEQREREHLLASGFQDHVSRPVDAWDLCRRVAVLAERRG
jgi:CheY-like chemotaxis protein